jgi:hypothetical protein
MSDQGRKVLENRLRPAIRLGRVNAWCAHGRSSLLVSFFVVEHRVRLGSVGCLPG